jgi:hypothetical protein
MTALVVCFQQHVRDVRGAAARCKHSVIDLDAICDVPPMPHMVALLLGYPFAYLVSHSSVVRASAFLSSESLMLCTMRAELSATSLQHLPASATRSGLQQPCGLDTCLAGGSEIVLWSCSVPIAIDDVSGDRIDVAKLLKVWAGMRSERNCSVAGIWEQVMCCADHIPIATVAL